MTEQDYAAKVRRVQAVLDATCRCGKVAAEEVVAALLDAPAPSEPVREAVFDALTALRSLASDATSAADALSLAINRHRAALAAPAPSEPGLDAETLQQAIVNAGARTGDWIARIVAEYARLRKEQNR